MTKISYPILIQKVDEEQKLEYYGCYSLNVQEGIPVAVLEENALETVKAPKGLKLRVEQYWLLVDPVSILRTWNTGKSTFPSKITELKKRADYASEIHGPEGQISMILVALFEPITPTPNRLHAVDENSALPTREEVVTAGRKQDSPSTGTKNNRLRKTQTKTNLGAIFNHCPLELSPPNITIFHPVFAKFIRLMNENSSDVVFTAAQLNQAYRFIEILTSFYPNEGD
ncbi:hypothetical protein BT96DRAFT_991224 [Gymnopus androsaceus JB14]|uniref:Uncharacterized protein n=1 Tax=Gymnopus androsaceus JB14 TaxID=1447944 RepID=A0A6A4HTB2_9AGAR|nr:hypothetical protein BT96DRAFT_991224 [Gymnopus androsaceus JB14]